MFFFLGVTAIPFLILGPFLIIGGLRRPAARKRMVYSGLGSIVLGAGEFALPYSLAGGIVLIALGVVTITVAVRMGVQ